MKFKLSILLIIGCFFFLPKISHAESISSYAADIHINQDASINVNETIIYNFETAAHHGIFRDIPYHYAARGGNYNLRISVNSVKDEAGNPYQYTTSKTGGNVEIKIGDPNAAVTGIHTY